MQNFKLTQQIAVGINTHEVWHVCSEQGPCLALVQGSGRDPCAGPLRGPCAGLWQGPLCRATAWPLFRALAQPFCKASSSKQLQTSCIQQTHALFPCFLPFSAAPCPPPARQKSRTSHLRCAASNTSAPVASYATVSGLRCCCDASQAHEMPAACCFVAQKLSE